MSVISYFSCATCGAPLTSKIKVHGFEQCLYCDTVSVFKERSVQTKKGTPSKIDKSIGTARRYGTVLIAPALGWSACTLFNIQRHSLTYENLDGLLVAFSIFALMILHRWMMASIWLLFCCLAFLLERTQALHTPGPLEYFSFTAEVTLMPLGICAFLITWFVLFLVMQSDSRLEHEQQKLVWRTPVAITFSIGLLGGLYYYSQPMTLEVYKNWSWPYANEMQRLTSTSWEIDTQYKPARIPKDLSPQPIWIDRSPEKSNTVFFPKEYIDLFPKNNFHIKNGSDHLWLTGDYTNYLEFLPDSVRNGYFSPPITQKDWKEKITAPLLADWLILYEYKEQEEQICFWLVKRESSQKHYEFFNLPEYRFEIVGFHQFDWSASLVDIKAQKKARDKLLSVLRTQTGGTFQTNAQ